MNKISTRGIAAGALTLLASAGAMAQATDPVTTLFGGINLTAVSAAVVAVLLLVVGIAMAFKGGDLAKRAVRKV